jgi:hypothetical protein
MYEYFMTEDATIHTADFSKAVQEEVFGERSGFLASNIIEFHSIRLFVGETERQSLCEKSTYFARIPK